MAKKKSDTRITDVRPADANNQVVTVVGGDGSYMTKPCEQCPWRVDQTGKFPAEAFRHSANTAYDMAGKAFGCHMAGSENPKHCAGFLVNGAHHNMLIRMSLIEGKIDLDKVSDGGLELHESYRAMAEANGVDEDDPVLRPCRSKRE